MSSPVDEPSLSSYLRLMATRLLLTMLALMAGLAAQFSPAQARGCAGVGTEIGAVAASQARPHPHVSALSPREWPGWEARRLPLNAVPCHIAAATPVAPVLPGIDRARE